MIEVLTVMLLSTAEAKQVVCRVPGDPQVRVFALAQTVQGEWRLALRTREAGGTPVSVALPGAKPRFDDRGGARLSYRSANGGVIVELSSAAGGATLDVYVSYELEVNIDASLDPKVDLLNTNGPLRHVRCEVNGLSNGEPVTR